MSAQVQQQAFANAAAASDHIIEEDKMAKFLPRKGKEFGPYDDPNLLIVRILVDRSVIHSSI